MSPERMLQAIVALYDWNSSESDSDEMREPKYRTAGAALAALSDDEAAVLLRMYYLGTPDTTVVTHPEARPHARERLLEKRHAAEFVMAGVLKVVSR